jgi:hypothetical protein
MFQCKKNHLQLKHQAMFTNQPSRELQPLNKHPKLKMLKQKPTN